METAPMFAMDCRVKPGNDSGVCDLHYVQTASSTVILDLGQHDHSSQDRLNDQLAT